MELAEKSVTVVEVVGVVTHMNNIVLGHVRCLVLFRDDDVGDDDHHHNHHRRLHHHVINVVFVMLFTVITIIIIIVSGLSTNAPLKCK